MLLRFRGSSGRAAVRKLWMPEQSNSVLRFAWNNSALHDRRLRNALEHFDERLDDFLIADPSGTFFPGAMVRPHALADDPVGQIFRLVDPFDLVFVILGQKYEFGAVWDEVKRIHDLALTMDSSGRLFFPERP